MGFRFVFGSLVVWCIAKHDTGGGGGGGGGGGWRYKVFCGLSIYIYIKSKKHKTRRCSMMIGKGLFGWT